jgi:hypothetical protein
VNSTLPAPISVMFGTIEIVLLGPDSGKIARGCGASGRRSYPGQFHRRQHGPLALKPGPIAGVLGAAVAVSGSNVLAFPLMLRSVELPERYVE